MTNRPLGMCQSLRGFAARAAVAEQEQLAARGSALAQKDSELAALRLERALLTPTQIVFRLCARLAYLLAA
jgi:hypothetical protein